MPPISDISIEKPFASFEQPPYMVNHFTHVQKSESLFSMAKSAKALGRVAPQYFEIAIDLEELFDLYRNVAKTREAQQPQLARV